MKISPWRVLAVSCIVFACACFVVGMFPVYPDDKHATKRKPNIREDVLRIPYTHLILECIRGAGTKGVR